jgi:proton-coupled amino acid transporter
MEKEVELVSYISILNFTNIVFLNSSKFLNVIGFAIYSYEGIGVILPVMELTAQPEHYPKVLLSVLTTVLIVYVSFGELCYFVYGAGLENTPIILN